MSCLTFGRSGAIGQSRLFCESDEVSLVLNDRGPMLVYWTQSLVQLPMNLAWCE